MWLDVHVSQKSEVPEPVFNLEHGKGMDGLLEHEVVVDDLHDFAAVVAWGPKSMFLTFRGTASLKYGVFPKAQLRNLVALHHRNLSVDLNALQRRHPHAAPQQQSRCFLRNPNVHKGMFTH